VVGSSNVHIGREAGLTSQSITAVAVGNSAGKTRQRDYAVALGVQAGQTDQSGNAIAIGYVAGLNTQGNNAIAMGHLAGLAIQGQNAIAIGYQAGYNTQGTNAIAIGRGAGIGSQQPNSIVLLASGSFLFGAIPSSFFVAPIRSTTNPAILTYDASSSEISCSTDYITFNTPGTSSNDVYVTGIMAIGQSSITSGFALDILGDIRTTLFKAVSDYRIKDNVRPISTTIDNLHPYTYFNRLSGKEDMGFIAHELQEEIPFLVNGEKDGKNYQSINYLGLIGLLVKELQDLKKKIQELQCRIAFLEAHK
jgi:hypothetical protein